MVLSDFLLFSSSCPLIFQSDHFGLSRDRSFRLANAPSKAAVSSTGLPVLLSLVLGFSPIKNARRQPSVLNKSRWSSEVITGSINRSPSELSNPRVQLRRTRQEGDRRRCAANRERRYRKARGSGQPIRRQALQQYHG